MKPVRINCGCEAGDCDSYTGVRGLRSLETVSEDEVTGGGGGGGAGGGGTQPAGRFFVKEEQNKEEETESKSS